jgi:VanZ family protein
VINSIIRLLPTIIGIIGLIFFIASAILSANQSGIGLFHMAGVAISGILLLSGLRNLAPTIHRAKYYSALLCMYTAGILVMGLRPRSGRQNSAFLEIADFSLYDVTMNVLGFIPFAFLLVTVMYEQRFSSRIKRFIWAVAGCTTLSLVIELSQHLIAGRSSSLVDVAMNFIGAVIGSGYGILFGEVWRKKGRDSKTQCFDEKV